MKKLIVLSLFTFSFYLLPLISSAQQKDVDKLKKELTLARSDSTKFRILDLIAMKSFDSQQDTFMHYLKQELALANRSNNTSWKALAYSKYGRRQYVVGNYPLGLQWGFKSLQLAESINDSSIMGNILSYIGITYKEYEDYDKAKMYFLQWQRIAQKRKDTFGLTWSYLNLGEVYSKTNKQDSALFCTQQGYALALKNNFAGTEPFSLVLLGNVQKNLHNKNLALEYFIKGIEELKKDFNISRWLSQAYFSFADFYNRFGEKDSAIFFARLSMNMAKQIYYLKGISASSRFLSAIYDSLHETDSAFYYQKIFVAANDSLNSKKRTAGVENLSMLELIRQQEKEQALEKAYEERKQNIEYALIALGIVTFIILFLLLIRSVVIPEKLIEVLGVIALLIVFEFLNLLLHPFFGKITNENPLFMLLALVCIAGLLVPMHHRIEKWATRRLVEKNKQIRLAAAKKTIEKLEKNIHEPENA